MVQIIPTILVKTFKEFRATVKKIEHDFPITQVDIMDGKFVPNTTFSDIQAIGKIKTPLKYEVHLMVEDPLNYIKELRITNYGLKSKSAIRNPLLGNKIIKVLFHYEAKSNIQKTVKVIREFGLHAGLVLNPETEIEKITKFLPMLDCVMLMGVHPGFAGQKYIPNTVKKVKQLRRMNRRIDIEIDGGVSDQNARALVAAGANILAIHSFLYQDDIKKQKEKLIQSIQ